MKLVCGTAAAAVLTAATAMGATGVGAVSSGDVLEYHTSPAAAVVCWVGNVCNGATGTYTFQTAAGACTGIDDGKKGTCSITSSGAFTNIVCGTGSVIGSRSSATATESDGDTATLNNLSITFVSGLGVATSTVTESGPGGKTAKGYGVVQISPTHLTPPKPGTAGDGVCTPGFTVESVAATTA